jgi:hypothetical protein
MLRDELVKALNERRNNDVRVAVPLWSGGAAMVGIDAVNYDATTDTIEILTEEHYDGPDPEGAVS